MRTHPFAFRKTVPPAVHHLLDGEQSDQNAADWNGDIKRCYRSHRRHAQAFEDVEEVEVAEIGHAKRHGKDDRAVEKFEEKTAVAGHRFSEHGKVEMIIAAGGGGDAKKNSIEKEAHRRLLGKKPGMTDDAQNHVR